jgi:hypothetical protein
VDLWQSISISMPGSYVRVRLEPSRVVGRVMPPLTQVYSNISVSDGGRLPDNKIFASLSLFCRANCDLGLLLYALPSTPQS